MSILENSLNSLFSKVPIFKDNDDIKLEIKIEIKESSTTYIFINVRDNSNYPIKLQNLNRSQLEFFLQEYRNFIISGKYNKSKSSIGKIQSAIQISLMLLKNKKISKFYFSLRYGLPLTNTINKLYTIDEFDNSCIAITEMKIGKMCNIIDQNTSNKLIPFFHNLSLTMIYDLNLNESEYYTNIFKQMKFYLRIIVPTIISIYTINNFINNLHSTPTEFAIYIFMLILSLFPNVLFKVIINLFIHFFINKNSLISYIEEKIRFLKKNLQ